MRILVTGGAGFIGSNLVLHLAEKIEHNVRVIDNLSVTKTPPRFPSAVEFIQGDFTDRRVLASSLRDVFAVVHLAALSGVIDSIDDPRPSFETNVAGTFQLLNLCREAGVRRIVNASTGGALLGEVAAPISEAMAPSPMSPYGATKLAAEGYCSAFAAAYGLSCISLRFSNIYGQRSAHKKSAVAAFIKNGLDGGPLTIYGDGTQRRDYLYVGDLVIAIADALTCDVTGSYQLATGRPTSLNQLIAAIEIAAGRELEKRFEPARRGEVHSTWCDISKARRDLRFVPTTTIEAGIATTWDWFARNRAFWSPAMTLTSSD